MSVRKNTVRSRPREERGGWRFVRGALFWLFLLLASFAVGALIISPLINVASGRSEPDRPAPQQTTKSDLMPGSAPSMQAQTSSTAPPREERRRADDEPTILITPDEPSRLEVQPPQNPDESVPNSADASRSVRIESGDVSLGRDARVTAPARTTRSNQTSDGEIRRARREAVAPDDAAAREMRRPRPPAREETRAPRPAPPPAPSIQQGESIDE